MLSIYLIYLSIYLATDMQLLRLVSDFQAAQDKWKTENPVRRADKERISGLLAEIDGLEEDLIALRKDRDSLFMANEALSRQVRGWRCQIFIIVASSFSFIFLHINM